VAARCPLLLSGGHTQEAHDGGPIGSRTRVSQIFRSGLYTSVALCALRQQGTPVAGSSVARLSALAQEGRSHPLRCIAVVSPVPGTATSSGLMERRAEAVRSTLTFRLTLRGAWGPSRCPSWLLWFCRSFYGVHDIPGSHPVLLFRDRYRCRPKLSAFRTWLDRSGAARPVLQKSWVPEPQVMPRLG